MITSFKKNIHSFFFTLPSNAPTANTAETGGGGGAATHKLHFHHPVSSGLVSATTEPDRPPNVVESSMLVKPNSPPSSPSTIGFTDEIGGQVNGLMSCTESLGFESSNEREIHNTDYNHHDDFENGDGNCKKKNPVNCDWMTRSRSRRGECRKVRSFPPPLSSLNRNGEPSFFLRPVRKDGRLELTEVRIHRPQILHAWRHDGRLTLHFVPNRSIEEEEEEEIEEEERQEQEIVEEKEMKEKLVMIDEEKEEEMEEGENGFGEYRFGNEGLRRCHEMVNHHPHHHHHHHHMRMCGISTV